MKHWLFKVEDNWADEMDIDGFLVLSDEGYNKWKEAFQEFEVKFMSLIKDNIDLCLKYILSKRHDTWFIKYSHPELQTIIDNPNPDTWSDNEWKIIYNQQFGERTMCIGTNEDMTFENLQQVLDAVSITEISEDFAQQLKDHSIYNMGFAGRYYDYIFDLIENIEEEGVNFLRIEEDEIPY